MRKVDKFKIKSEKSSFPINKIRLIKKSIDILKYKDNNFWTALFFLLILHINIVKGIPIIKIDESWNVTQVENSLIDSKVFIIFT